MSAMRNTHAPRRRSPSPADDRARHWFRAGPQLNPVVCRLPFAPLRHQNHRPIRGVGPGHLAELRFGAGRGIAALSPASLVDDPWMASPPSAASRASDFASLPALTQVKCSGLPMRVPRDAGAPTNLISVIRPVIPKSKSATWRYLVGGAFSFFAARPTLSASGRHI
jgi:hypothetical protein